MDENRLKKVVQSALDLSYDKSLLISEFIALQTHIYDVDKGDWVPDSYSLFLDLKRYNRIILWIVFSLHTFCLLCQQSYKRKTKVKNDISV